MDLRQFNNHIVKVQDIDGQTFTGICSFEGKDNFDEKWDALSIKEELQWVRLFEDEIQSVEII